jgi:hydrogenase-4 component B
MIDSLFFYFAFLFPLAGMVLIALLPHSLKAPVNFIFVLLSAVTTSIPAIKALGGDTVHIFINQSIVFGNISLQIDSLSAWFILIINLTCLGGAFFGIGYMKQYTEQRTGLSMHWILFLLFQASMLWVCMVQNGLAFLIVWELMSISSFLLVIFEHQNKTTLHAGLNYFIQMHIGVMFLTAAFIWVYFSEGSFEFSSIEKFFSTKPNVWLFLLFFVGFGIKAGFIPLHSWLPQAHPAAPAHISGVMSGVIVKLGIYGIFRVLFFLHRDYTLIGEIILLLSVFTGLYGILNAAVHRDYKKMLAYCTIENIGIIGIGIGLGLMGMGNGNKLLMLLGFSGALLHTLNHSLFKSLLFFTAGSVYNQTHTRDMEKLGGLIHSMPTTAALFLIGGLAIGGLPPFNGFVSEFLLYSGIIEGIKSITITYLTPLVIALGGLAIIGGVSMLTFTKSFGTIFLGTPRTQLHHPPQEVGLGMRLPQYFIILLMLSIGLFPQFYFSVVSDIVVRFIPSLASERDWMPTSLINSMSSIGKYSMLFMLVLMLMYAIRKSVTRQHPFTTAGTWGCGYDALSPKMQYTGKSFSKSLGKLLSFAVLEQKKYKEISGQEIFPETRKHSSHYNDFFVSRVIDIIVDRMLYSLNYFQFIQNGKLQLYILYGVFFIVLLFLGTIFRLI